MILKVQLYMFAYPSYSSGNTVALVARMTSNVSATMKLHLLNIINRY